jgi:putative transposase
VDVDRKENTEPSGTTIGLDVGLKEYYTDSNGTTVENPRFLIKGEKSSNALGVAYQEK